MRRITCVIVFFALAASASADDLFLFPWNAKCSAEKAKARACSDCCRYNNGYPDPVRLPAVQTVTVPAQQAVMVPQVVPQVATSTNVVTTETRSVLTEEMKSVLAEYAMSLREDVSQRIDNGEDFKAAIIASVKNQFAENEEGERPARNLMMTLLTAALGAAGFSGYKARLAQLAAQKIIDNVDIG